MSETDHAVAQSLAEVSDFPQRLWLEQDPTAGQEQPADFATGLVSLGFIKAAIRRSRRAWSAAAVTGLLAGLGFAVALPPKYEASASVLVSQAGLNAGDQIFTDVAVAHSRTVAELALHKLGLRESANSFLSKYTVTNVTDQLLVFTVSAPTGNEAVSQAAALATVYVRFRANLLESDKRLVLASLNQALDLARQRSTSIVKQISRLRAGPASPARAAGLASLRTQQGQAVATATTLQQTINATRASLAATTTQQVDGTRILDAAALLPRSRFKPLVLAAAIGLVAGLVLSIGIVVIRALVSDRLRRRDDVAHALGASVRLAVGSMKPRRLRRLPDQRSRTIPGGRDMRRIVAHLRDCVPASSHQAGALVVVAVDDPRVAAFSLAELAVSCAREGQRVVVADLAAGAPAARLLGARDHGVSSVRVREADLLAMIPSQDDLAPAGPHGRTPGHAAREAPHQLAAACASADVLLTLATLDPALGGEHLATWAVDAVVMVTAGRSSWAKVRAAGEMLRIAGMRVVSAVLVGSDKTDESLGLARAPSAASGAEAAPEDLTPDRKI